MKDHGRGFTLVELMVVIGILAISAAIVYPRLDSPYSESARLSRSAKHLASVVRYAQDLAISTQQPHVLHIDLEAQTYSVTARSPRGADTPTKKNLNLGRRLAQDICFDQVEIADRDESSQDSVSLTFGAEGEVDTGFITLVAPTGRAVRLVFNESWGSAGPCEIQWIE
jgi:type II secretion system protein H